MRSPKVSPRNDNLWHHDDTQGEQHAPKPRLYPHACPVLPIYYRASKGAEGVETQRGAFSLQERRGVRKARIRPVLPIRPGTRGATVVFRTLRRLSPTLVHHLAGPRRIVCTAASCWSSSDGRLPVVQPSIRRLRRRQFAPIN